MVLRIPVVGAVHETENRADSLAHSRLLNNKTHATASTGVTSLSGLFRCMTSHACLLSQTSKQGRVVRCMFTASVAVGKPYKTHETFLDPAQNQCPPPGYDSVIGEVSEFLALNCFSLLHCVCVHAPQVYPLFIFSVDVHGSSMEVSCTFMEVHERPSWKYIIWKFHETSVTLP